MEEESNLFQGLFWGVSLSIPLWMSFIGWIQLFIRVFSKLKFGF